jgi:folate-binding protein YgfZ
MSTSPTLCPVTDFTLLTIAGPDCRKFLQGQVTCDSNEITSESSRLGAHCNPKGRMISNFRALGIAENTLGLRCHREVLPALSQSLGKYIVFSKADITDQGNQLGIYGLLGENIAEQLGGFLGTTLNQNNDACVTDAGHFIRISDAMIECWLTPEQAGELSNALNCCAGEQSQWLMAAIRAGFGDVYPATQNEWIPQVLNYQAEAVGGVNFQKGCYTGQEIVARMQYRGKLKRHMYRFSSPETVTPGQHLFSQGKTQSIGEVVMCSQVGNEIECLANVTTEAVEANDVYIDADKEQRLTLLPLPYELTAAINT